MAADPYSSFGSYPRCFCCLPDTADSGNPCRNEGVGSERLHRKLPDNGRSYRDRQR